MKSATDRLLEIAKKQRMTSEEKEQQRRSFAYGNANFENERVTREMIDRAAERLEAKRESED